MIGVVYKSTGLWYKVKTYNNVFVNARLKGLIRLENNNSTNPIAVGDIVELEKDGTDFMICKVSDRKNYIIRTSPRKKNQTHILGSNLDQAILVVTISNPRTSTGFIDRFILTAQAYHIPTVLIFNKQDVLKEKDIEKQLKYIALYKSLNYKCLKVSSVTLEGIKEAKEELTNKTSLLVGHSGSGKSTFANAIDSDLKLKTGAISKKFKKGKHTTTYAEMYDLNLEGRIIDIPGVKEFGIVGFEKHEVSHYFVEMIPFLSQCKYNNCLHINEPNCAVLTALNKGEVSETRYQNYLNILVDVEDELTKQY